ncbi:MAG: TonB family protein [Pseudomonadota bacterium]
MTGVVLAALLAVATAPQPAADAAIKAAEAACPAPRTVLPRYPVDLARANKTGLVLVGARFDDCGRILETRIDDSAGRKAFDEAAEASVALYVLSPEQRATATDGWVQVPVKFGGFKNVEARKIPWPRSHRKPLYLPDEQSLPFASIRAFEEAKVIDTRHFLHPPYGRSADASGRIMQTWMHPEKDDESVFWLQYNIQPPLNASPADRTITAAIARYRLVEEDGVPVVRLGLLCERPADECERLREFLFKGLPFAKARGR